MGGSFFDRYAITEFFHLIHVLDDEDEVDAWYDAVFAPKPFIRKTWTDIEKRWASLSSIGDFMIEVIEPSDALEHREMPLSEYENALGARILHQVEAVDRESVFMFVGNETVVELASPTGVPSRLSDDVANGELPHACTFTVRDLDAVERHDQSVGVRVAERGGERLTLEPADFFGAVYSFTTSSVPGDPRPSRPSPEPAGRGC